MYSTLMATPCRGGDQAAARPSAVRRRQVDCDDVPAPEMAVCTRLPLSAMLVGWECGGSEWADAMFRPDSDKR
jgi:hypothetical protein